MEEKVKLTITEKINRAKDGRSQSWVVEKMNERGIVMTDVMFSRKKKGRVKFTEEELKILSEILGVDFS